MRVLLGGAGGAGAAPGVLAVNLSDRDIPWIRIEHFMRDISLLRELQSFTELHKIFKQEKPDVVHLNSSKAGGVGALAARLAGIKTIIFTAHGWPFLEDRSRIGQTVIWLASWITALLATKVICISTRDEAIAKRMPFVHHKIVLIHNGAGPIEFASGEDIRKEFQPGTTIIGTLGELTDNKNQDILIDVARQHPDLHVAVVGFGEKYKELEAQIKEHALGERVKLFGFMREVKVLGGFDIFVLPSKKEGLPYVLLEAGLASLPVIASDVGGIPDIVEDGATGLLIDPRDPGTLTSALTRLMNDESLRHTLGVNLHTKVTTEFSLEQMVEETKKLYTH